MSAEIHTVNQKYMKRAGRFMQLWKRIDAKGNAISAFKNIYEKYLEKERHYHTYEHIDACLEDFDSAKHLSENPDALEIGIVGHDSIYEIGVNDNEERSADFMYNICLAADVNISLINDARNIILVSKHNKIPRTIDEELMIDIDLLILGKPENIFNEYEKNIWLEYKAKYNEQEYMAGRADFLKKNFLEKEKRPCIYYTEYFKDKYERKARENLEMSINRLKKGILIK
jgi:predicted metal-dependent HD superfamily phosphohydrolase